MIKMWSLVNFLDGFLLIFIKFEDEYERRYIYKCEDVCIKMFIMALYILVNREVVCF